MGYNVIGQKRRHVCIGKEVWKVFYHLYILDPVRSSCNLSGYTAQLA